METGITRIAVEGFKSIVKKQSIDIAPLTILAGANSSGKSSIIQPLLLLKQTLEADYDPGVLLLAGPNVKFTSADQFLSSPRESNGGKTMSVEIRLGERRYAIVFGKSRDGNIRLSEQKFGKGTLTPQYSASLKDAFRDARGKPPLPAAAGELSKEVESSLRQIIHVPGLRGNPERNYPAAATGPRFPGTFEKYIGSIIWRWRDVPEKQHSLNKDLEHLGLTKSVSARALSEAEIEIRVSRPRGSSREMLSLADVGLGVSQILPLIVALRVAGSRELVYIEQPEVHLHPRAQGKLADILAKAAKRRVKIVIETHSSLLLRAIQTLIAKGDLPPRLVRLHWFSLDNRGFTRIASAAMDKNGAFGEWPEDFGEVSLESDKEYLDAVESRIAR